MLKNFPNSRKQGNVGIGSAIAFLTTKGQTVSIPLTDSQEYDLIVDIDGLLKKVQVKTTYHKNKWNQFCVNIKTSGGNQSFHTIKKFDSLLVDFLFVLTQDGDRYFIPSDVIKAKAQLVLGHRMLLYKI